ncbi:MAG: hypothetical protein EPO01_06685, partial [Aquabacterium sp.]
MQLNATQAALVKLGMAAGQTAYALNNGGGLKVGMPLAYIDDYTTAGQPGAGPLALEIPSGYVVRAIYKDYEKGTDIFLAYDPQSKTFVIGAGGTNGLPADRPDTAEDLIRMGVRQTRDAFGVYDTGAGGRTTGLDKDIAAILAENNLSASQATFVIGGQSLGGGIVKQLGAVLV